MRQTNSTNEMRIMIDPAICNGRPIVKGTRITVQSILEYLAAGDSVETILAEFPQLNRSDIEASLAYASRMMANRLTIEHSAL